MIRQLRYLGRLGLSFAALADAESAHRSKSVNALQTTTARAELECVDGPMSVPSWAVVVLGLERLSGTLLIKIVPTVSLVDYYFELLLVKQDDQKLRERALIKERK